MLDQLTNLVKQFAGESIVNNPEIPNEKNQEAMAEASNTVVSGLQNVLAGGGLQSILNLFSQGGGQSGQGGGVSGLMQNPIVNMMAGHFMKKLMSKFGLNSGAASNVATSLIPNVLNGLISKTQDPNDKSIDLNSVISALTGGNVPTSEASNSGGGGGGFDFQGLLNQFMGGGGGSNSGGGGGFNIQDIISKVTQGAQQNQEQEVQQKSGGGGGLMDMLKGLIGG